MCASNDSQDDICIMHIGGCPDWVEEQCYQQLVNRQLSKFSSFTGKLSTTGVPFGIAERMSAAATASAAPSTWTVGTCNKISLGQEHSVWGTLRSFKGQLTAIAIFNDTMPDSWWQNMASRGKQVLLPSIGDLFS